MYTAWDFLLDLRDKDCPVNWFWEVPKEARWVGGGKNSKGGLFKEIDQELELPQSKLSWKILVVSWESLSSQQENIDFRKVEVMIFFQSVEILTFGELKTNENQPMISLKYIWSVEQYWMNLDTELWKYFIIFPVW